MKQSWWLSVAPEEKRGGFDGYGAIVLNADANP
jgi:hypothetical protein